MNFHVASRGGVSFNFDFPVDGVILGIPTFSL